MAAGGANTPARQQYLEIKAQYPHALLWFRLGDFYEMFDDDARVASAALRITLTSRSFGKDCRVAMCGVPHHAHSRFLARLVRQGFSVAICEQTSPAGHGLVERQVVRVVTPGTISEPEILKSGENNYLAAVARRGGLLALAYVDVSTGEFRVAQTADEAALLDELERLAAAECLVEEGSDVTLPVRHTTRLEAAAWDPLACLERLRRHLGARALHIAGCEGQPAAAAAAGAILAYLERTNRALLNVLHSLRPYAVDEAVAIDAHTRTMLLGRPPGPGERYTSLHALLDRTCTRMGARLLAQWLRRPVRGLPMLLARQEAIAELLVDQPACQALGPALRVLGDLERLTGRVGQERAMPDELLALSATLEGVPPLKALLGERRSGLLRSVVEELDPAPDVAAGIRAAVAEPPSERLVRGGYDPSLDRLVEEAAQAREQLATLEATERARTGIRSLKVGYNQVFGYYIEVTNPNRDRVPPEYVRKQTMAHAERYVTEELLRWETALSQAEARMLDLDRERFNALQRQITAQAPRLLATAAALARLDAILALAEVADRHHFCRPELSEGTELRITGGRHPLVEAGLGPGAFIPNDCALGDDGPTLAVVTGPNMGGKSTYLRQIALIVYLAQTGSFVPAAAARIGLADRIFARVGAHDDLVAGHSTFLVEMAETAAIVRLATPRSLVLLDEIGRGTTSADGQAIARAVAEYLHDIGGARTLFATHYSEIARAAEGWPQACNLHVQAEEHEGQVVFLYRVTPGVADRSFALHVARMAGMPETIILRAAELLAAREAAPEQGAGRAQGATSPAPARAPLRLAEVAGAPHEAVIAALLRLDLASMTPIEALNGLYALQQQARSQGQEGAGRTARGLPA